VEISELNKKISVLEKEKNNSSNDDEKISELEEKISSLNEEKKSLEGNFLEICAKLFPGEEIFEFNEGIF